MNYNNKRSEFKIKGVQIETVREPETYPSVIKGRKLYLKAAIVRIMKFFKSLRHDFLVQEVLNESNIKARFAPSISLVEETIKMLKATHYLERTFFNLPK